MDKLDSTSAWGNRDQAKGEENRDLCSPRWESKSAIIVGQTRITQRRGKAGHGYCSFN